MTDEEAGYLAENLWLYRVRRRMSRHALAARIVDFQKYRDYEYGTAIPKHDELEAFAKRLQTDAKALLQPPNYKWLLKNHQVRKILGNYCLLQEKHRQAVITVTRAMQQKN